MQARGESKTFVPGQYQNLPGGVL
uniref:Uncharacterized protein n=1 Tax=Anguilla anguilla TaxID=7936 RepID=A0A0E9QCP2_ANGAN